MGWFTKKEEKKEEIPSLPKLPKLPELPGLDEEIINHSNEPLSQLPSFPNTSFGEKFSQNAIKDAVSGKEEGEEDFADDFEETDNQIQMMQKPLKKPLAKEIDSTENEEEHLPFMKPNREFEEPRKKAEETGPIFIRIDKFKESLQIFKDTENKIAEIEKMLRDTKTIKEKEEKELKSWENEIQEIKKQFDKLDQEIFSKI